MFGIILVALLGPAAGSLQDAAATATSGVAVIAVDLDGAPVAGLRMGIAWQPPETLTGADGVVVLPLPDGVRAGQTVPVQIAEVADSGAEYLRVEPSKGLIRIPPGAPANRPVEIVVTKKGNAESFADPRVVRAVLERILAQVSSIPSKEAAKEFHRHIVGFQAEVFRLDPETVETALGKFTHEANDPYDKGLARFYEWNLDEAEASFLEATESRKGQGRDSLDAAADAAFFLGAVRFESGRYESAVEALEEAAGLRRADGMILNHLGMAFLRSGEYEKAEKSYREALQAARGEFGGKTTLAYGLHNLGALYAALGRFDEAEALLLEGSQIFTEQGGEHDPAYFSCLQNLGYIYESQGRYQEAEPFFLETVRFTEQILGEEHSVHLASVGNLAILYGLLGRDHDAEKLYLDVIERLRLKASEEHLMQATALNNLGEHYRNRNRHGEAEALFVEALQVVTRGNLEQDPAHAIILNNLGLTYIDEGRYAEAEMPLQRALYIQRSVLGTEHPDYAASLYNLALVYESQGRYEEAQPLYFLALRIARQSFGDEHPVYGDISKRLALVYFAQGRAEEAEPHFRHALDVFRKTLQPGHPSVEEVLEALSDLLTGLGRAEEAAALRKEVEAGRPPG